jgi:hypothetical protein
LILSFDGRAIIFGFGELDTLVPAYAITIHKSQGSEYPVVVIPLLTQHYAMLQRNLLYTGVTRGKRLVVLVGQKKAVAIAVKNVSGRRRWSKLNEWLSAPSYLWSKPSKVGVHFCFQAASRPWRVAPDRQRMTRKRHSPDRSLAVPQALPAWHSRYRRLTGPPCDIGRPAMRIVRDPGTSQTCR